MNYKDSEDLLEHLKEIYPDRMPLKEMEKYELGKMAGKIELLQEIELLIKQKTDEELV